MRDSVLKINGQTYRWPQKPTVVICIDGNDPAYFDHGLARGILPNIASFVKNGFATIAEGIVPSFTNPNNLSIATGAPPRVHGISGNFFLDPETGDAVMMNDPRYLRAETIFAVFARRGANVAVVTAKDKLRRLLGHGMERGICFSTERASVSTAEENGIDDVLGLIGRRQPDVYSAELSLYAIEAGIRLLETQPIDLMYISLTDYIQHKFAPEASEAEDFYAELDRLFGRLIELGAIVGLIGDHGMSDKSLPDGSPNVIFLQDELDYTFGRGTSKVICPITDPYVVHHGALGGYARVYCRGDVTASVIIERLAAIRGIENALPRNEAALKFDLPPEYEGDVAVIANANTALGASRHEHDLSALGGMRLRSHGGTSENRVPLMLSHPLNEEYADCIREHTLASYRIFELALNAVNRMK